MTNEEYKETQDLIVSTCRIILYLELPEFLNRIENAEAFGPILDPTLYRDAMGPLGEIKTLAEALNDTRETIKKLIAKKGFILIKEWAG